MVELDLKSGEPQNEAYFAGFNACRDGKDRDAIARTIEDPSCRACFIRGFNSISFSILNRHTSGEVESGQQATRWAITGRIESGFGEGNVHKVKA